MNWLDFSQYLSEQLQQEIHIKRAHSVSGGDIHQAFQLQTNNGLLFLKTNLAQSLPLFAAEAHSLSAISKTQSIFCPEPLGYGQFEQQAWLLMPHLELTSQGDDFQRGKKLAALHQQINQDSKPFGWFENNFIGHTLQPNQWSFDWVNFYGQQRLMPQLELSQLNGASRKLYDIGIELIEALPFWFQDYNPKASLLHGDLWGGNSAFMKNASGNEPIIYDPASYYGDREADIAMTELFGGFSADFYAGYNHSFALDKGYKNRKTLYNLYHVINHFNLFGGHYEQQALNTIHQLLKQVN